MPLDPMMTDALLGPFKNMVQECRDKNMSGEYFDKMSELYNHLEELTRTHDDMMAFNMQVLKEDIYVKISDCYSRLLSSQAQEQQKEIGYDDAALLKQNLDALRDAIKRIEEEKARAIQEARSYDPVKSLNNAVDFAQRSNTLGSDKSLLNDSDNVSQIKKAGQKEINKEISERPNAYNNDVEIDTLIKTELYTKPIEDLIKLGEEPGMTYPKYLRIQIEKGMDKALEGSLAVRSGIVFSYGMAKALPSNPYYVENQKQKLELFDKLSAESKLNFPNSDELHSGFTKIDYHFAPLINEWKEITDRWESLLYDLYLWSLSYCDIAPYILPWRIYKDPHQAVIDTQKTQPGLFKQREKLLQKYFGIGFYDIFKHPSFEWQVRYKFIGDSQEFIEFLIEKIYPICIPLQDLPSDIIPIRSSFYKDKKEMNPDLDKTILPMVEYYNSVFGEGRWQSKYKMPEKLDSKAMPWNWETFKYK
jgi:uncharacterized protein YdaT